VGVKTAVLLESVGDEVEVGAAVALAVGVVVAGGKVEGVSVGEAERVAVSVAGEGTVGVRVVTAKAPWVISFTGGLEDRFMVGEVDGSARTGLPGVMLGGTCCTSATAGVREALA